MPSELSCAVVQLQSGDDVEANLQALRQSVLTAAQRGAKLVVLPENFAFFGAEQARAAVAEELDSGGPIQECLSQLSRELGLYVIGGGMPERSTEAARPYNTCAVWDPAGQVIAR